MVRSLDGGDTWEAVGAGLDTVVVTALEVAPGRLLAGGAGRVHSSSDAGTTWTSISDGLPRRRHLGAARDLDGADGRRHHVGLVPPRGRGEPLGARDGGRSTRLRRRATTRWPPLASGRLLASTYTVVYLSGRRRHDVADQRQLQHVRGVHPRRGQSQTGDRSDLRRRRLALGRRRNHVGERQRRVREHTRDLARPRWRRPAARRHTASATGEREPLGPDVETVGELDGARPDRLPRLRDDADECGHAARRGQTPVYTSRPMGGASWARSQDVTRTVYSIAETAAGTLLAGTFDQGVARSTDGGASWTSVDTPEGRVRVVAAAPGGTAYAGLDNVSNRTVPGGVLRSDDDGATWSFVNSGFGFEPSRAQALAVDRAGTVYASFSERPGPFRSDDQGTTWTEVRSGLTGSTTLLATDRRGVVVVAQSDGSLYQSRDGSPLGRHRRADRSRAGSARRRGRRPRLLRDIRPRRVPDRRTRRRERRSGSDVRPRGRRIPQPPFARRLPSGSG